MRSELLVTRLAGAIWGHLIGDAVGVPYEFRSSDQIGEVRFGATGSHHQLPGTWSDDGALMLALLDSLLAKGFDPEDQGARALAWRDTGAYTPNGEGFFDIGGTTGRALAAIRTGTPAERAGPDDVMACGNGSLMRILPLALVERGVSPAELVDHADRASGVTHGHPRAKVACALYVLVARALLLATGVPDVAGIMVAARTELRGVYQSMPRGQPYLDALHHLESWTGRAGLGRVWDSFWSAWDAFAGASDYARPSSGPSATATTRTPRRPSPAGWPVCAGASMACPPTGWRGCAGERSRRRWWMAWSGPWAGRRPRGIPSGSTRWT